MFFFFTSFSEVLDLLTSPLTHTPQQSVLWTKALLPKVRFQVSSLYITWELVRNEKSQTSPQSYQIRICILTSSLGDFHAYSGLRNTGLENVWPGIKQIIKISQIEELVELKCFGLVSHRNYINLRALFLSLCAH